MHLFVRVRHLAAIAAAAIPTLALAHPGHEGDHGITWELRSGFEHPFAGWDHVLAMVAVGLWAAQLGGRLRWSVPGAFVAAMAAAAVLGHVVGPVAAIEHAVAASVLILGMGVALAGRFTSGVALVTVALAGAFHGFAHGAELPGTANGATYGIGFILATGLLHATGLFVGTIATRRRLPRLGAWTGWAIVASGLVFLFR